MSTREPNRSLLNPRPPLKTAPPELVTRTVPILVLIAPATAMAPVVLNVMLELEPAPAVPVSEAKLIGPELPSPKVTVMPLAAVTAPRVIVPEPPAMATLLLKLMGALKLIAWLVALIWLPDIEIEDAAVAVTPPTKLKISPELSPRVIVPVL